VCFLIKIMADWFKFYNDGLDEPRFQYAISEQSSVTGVWLLILSEASKKRSARITWRDLDFELFGYAKKLNISVPILNQCIGILERIEYISRKDGCITISEWDKRQSDYAKGLDKGYYNKTKKKLASKSEVSTTRREEKRGEEITKKAKTNLEEVETFCKELGLPKSDSDWFFYKCEGSGWTNGGKPIKDWRATIRAWKAAGYMPSQKTNGFLSAPPPVKPAAPLILKKHIYTFTPETPPTREMCGGDWEMYYSDWKKWKDSL
jgi:hypothetical protein